MAVGYLRKRAFARGVLGDSSGWFALWAMLAFARVVRRFTKPKPKVLFREALTPGEVVVIRHGEQALES
jgi:hypothetical protein